MSSGLLVVSKRLEDEKMGEEIAASIGLRSIRLTQGKLIRKYLEDTPDAVTIFDAELRDQEPSIAELIFARCEPRSLFMITDEPLRKVPGLLQYQMFHHHLVRKPEGPAWKAYAKLVKIVHSKGIPCIADHFPKNTPIKKLTIKEPAHKYAATDAIQKFLMKENVAERAATVVSQAVEELIANAIFDAPVDSQGNRKRWAEPRTAKFTLAANEHVDVEIASSDDLMGICVTDHFGSLKRSTLMAAVGKHYYKAAFKGDVSDTDPGLGLRGIYDSGLSLMFAGIPGMETWAMIIFRKSENFMHFRNGPHFFSMLVE